jgi:hypothetical protein
VSETEEAAALGEIFRPNALERRPERGQRGLGRLRVGGVRFYEKVHVFCIAGLRVIDNRVCPNYEISNSMGMEGGQKVFVVLVHPG